MQRKPVSPVSPGFGGSSCILAVILPSFWHPYAIRLDGKCCRRSGFASGRAQIDAGTPDEFDALPYALGFAVVSAIAMLSWLLSPHQDRQQRFRQIPSAHWALELVVADWARARRTVTAGPHPVLEVRAASAAQSPEQGLPARGH
jgi:hypothetical protein